MKKYEFVFPENIRVFNLDDGRQVYADEPGKLHTDDRRLALMIKEAYAQHVTMTTYDDAVVTNPPVEAPASEEHDDWGDDEHLENATKPDAAPSAAPVVVPAADPAAPPVEGATPDQK